MKKDWNFEQGFGTKEAKKQSEIKICYKKDEKIEKLRDNLKKFEKQNWNFEQGFRQKSEETICNQGLL